MFGLKSPGETWTFFIVYVGNYCIKLFDLEKMLSI